MILPKPMNHLDLTLVARRATRWLTARHYRESRP